VAASPDAIATCVGCGRERSCYHARSERPLCNSCYRRENIKRWKIGVWTPPVATCSQCGAVGPAWFARTDHPLCNSCHRRARPRSDSPGVLTDCERCAQRRPCWPTRDGLVLCNTCLRRRHSRAWTAPVATCAVCGERTQCRFAQTERPICNPCRVRELHPPRFPGIRECISCRQLRRMSLRLGALGDRGECERCYKRRLRAVTVCERCGLRRRPSASKPACCERCAGEQVRHVCGDCGVEGVNHTDGRCARCTLKEILRRLRADGDPSAIVRLEPYLQALAAGPQPWTAVEVDGLQPWVLDRDRARVRHPRNIARGA